MRSYKKLKDKQQMEQDTNFLVEKSANDINRKFYCLKVIKTNVLEAIENTF